MFTTPDKLVCSKFSVMVELLWPWVELYKSLGPPTCVNITLYLCINPIFKIDFSNELLT